MSTYPKGVIGPTPDYAWPQIERFDVDLMKTLMDRLIVPGNQYEWGGKADPDDDTQTVIKNGIDCSGLSKYVILRCTDIEDFPDGSDNQHTWVKKVGFKKSDGASGRLMDGVLRIAFLRPGALGRGSAGHVSLIRNGLTFESRGGAGPDARAWDTNHSRWQELSDVYVLTLLRK
jgi:hypothetical protein